MENNNINFFFISDLEGGRRTKGYVPVARLSQSGVTLATGVDLGQRNVQDLKNLGLSELLIEQLEPYLGVKAHEAVKLVAKKPLIINGSQASQIDEAVKKEATNRIIRRYNRHSETKFNKLAPEAQTVIASLAYQYGDNLPVRTPAFWSAIIVQDWEKTIEILRDFGDIYPTRRNAEADYLEKSL